MATMTKGVGQVEFFHGCWPAVLKLTIASPSGLAEWFGDNPVVQGTVGAMVALVGLELIYLARYRGRTPLLLGLSRDRLRGVVRERGSLAAPPSRVASLTLIATSSLTCLLAAALALLSLPVFIHTPPLRFVSSVLAALVFAYGLYGLQQGVGSLRYLRRLVRESITRCLDIQRALVWPQAVQLDRARAAALYAELASRQDLLLQAHEATVARSLQSTILLVARHGGGISAVDRVQR